MLPTFGGCVITVSKATMLNGVIDLEVDYTTAKEVDGLKGLGTYVTPVIDPLPFCLQISIHLSSMLIQY